MALPTKRHSLCSEWEILHPHSGTDRTPADPLTIVWSKLERTQVTVHPPPDDPVPAPGPPAAAGGRRSTAPGPGGRTPCQRKCPLAVDRLAVGAPGGPGELSRMRDLSLKSSPSIATSTSRQSTSCSDVALEREVTMYGCFKFNPSSR
ncbi:AGAP004555-PA-like protein [Anopheles sinensis]|uniref:AGAP004555-PA-like protein n=1 Tax=Anopheles sinensis TaxID=74873 RepID=A0A084WTT9_ANOSI|nr:AGAP004555-PA-like protein [Anopheles sinensis]